MKMKLKYATYMMASALSLMTVALVETYGSWLFVHQEPTPAELLK